MYEELYEIVLLTFPLLSKTPLEFFNDLAQLYPFSLSFI